MWNPLVSIIIPTYNRRRWVSDCLDAIRKQSYPHVETVVIDDCSTDGTVEWLRSEAHYKFARILAQEKNSGAGEARSAGVRVARGDLVAFIDSDDILLPGHIAAAVEVFRQQPDVGLFCCDSTLIDSETRVLREGKTWHQIQSEIKGYPVSTGRRSLEDIFLFSNCFPGTTIRRGIFDQVGVFDQSMFPVEDYDFTLRVAGAGYGVFYRHEPLCLRREHATQGSGAANAVQVGRKMIKCLNAALRRNPELQGSLGKAARRRIAEVEIEMGVSKIYGGDRTGGVGTLLRAVFTDPQQIREVARLGKRRLRRMVMPV